MLMFGFILKLVTKMASSNSKLLLSLQFTVPENIDCFLKILAKILGMILVGLI